MLFAAIPALLLALLSPVFGYLFIVSVNGVYLYKNEAKQSVGFFAIIIAGTLILLSLQKVSLMEVGDIGIGVVAVTIVFISVLKRTESYVAAFFQAGILQILYGVFRIKAFGSIYEDRLETMIVGYRGYLEENVSVLGESVATQSSQILDSIMRIMVNYQVAIWSITMLLAMYLSIIFLSRRLDIAWKHHLIKFPYWFSYVLIIGLFFAIIPATRVIGFNILLMIMVFFLIQGLSIIDFISRNHFKQSRFIMIATVFLFIINFFFALMIATLGLLDYWLDIRKLDKE